MTQDEIFRTLRILPTHQPNNPSLKIISKVLAFKFNKVIDFLVDTSQSAFITGMCILYNVVTVKETIFNLQKGKILGNIIKVDFSKAFDIVDWDFLSELLYTDGFSSHWIGWIKRILYTSKASILVKGSVNGYVQNQRGLRQ